MRKLATPLVSLLFFAFLSHGQEHTLNLKSGTYQLTSSYMDLNSNVLATDSYHRIVVFNEIPTQEMKKSLKQRGIELLNYLPKNAYYARISPLAQWSTSDPFSVYAIASSFKQSEILSSGKYPHWTLFGDDQIELIAMHFISEKVEAIAEVQSLGGSVLTSIDELGSLHIRIPLAELENLYVLDAFYYFETMPEPDEPENFSGRHSHRSNTLWTDFSGGLQYRGDGVLVMMQDDGYIGEHIDYTGRIDQSMCNGCSTAAADTHGDHVAGTIMGAGNLNPKYRGMAHGVDLLVFSSSNGNYNSVPNLYDNEGLVITSKSYSNGCNGGYTSLAAQLDQQIRVRPNLTHVFSAGNDGASDCGYGAGSGWGNITGGHKSGKNVIAVGNLTSLDGLATSSSRGPATDGRIKPDICGVGSSVMSTLPGNTYESFTGTSMSCPGVAGTIAQLYDAYRDLNGGSDPHGALIKATVLNTADDLLNKGPDFKTGWGRINGRRAYDLLADQNYIYGSVGQGGNNTHTINVPAGVEELRIMVYWADHEGSTSAATALVNDINMVVTDPSLNDWNPWVLDPTPNPSNLDALAVRAVDNLNNMEQVTLDNPAAGSYTVDIDGFSIPQGPQDYYVVYYFVRDEIFVTYPVGGEGIDPDGAEVIRWDASEGTADFDLEYTTDNGTSWNPITTVNGGLRFFNWSIPNVATGEAKVRVTRNGVSGESQGVFSILDTPDNVHFEWACPDSTSLAWNTVSDATGYIVYALGNKYMDSIGYTTQTNFTIQANSSDEGWYSVRALGMNNARSERAVSIQKVPGEFNCTWSAPFAGFDIDCESGGTGHCFDMINESVNTDGASTYMWYFPGGTPATSTDETPQVCYSTAGDYDVALVVTNAAGSDSVYMSSFVHVAESKSLPYFEGFESYNNFIGLDEWSVYNPNGNQAFLITTDAALSGNKSARLFNYSQVGNFEDELISGPVDLSTLDPSDIMTLSFRYAYRKKFSGNDEWLKVFVTKGCEDNWVQRKTIHGDQLSSLTSVSNWAPASEADWTTVHMTNITSTYFTGDFRFKFEFESDNGNNFFLDNINIYEGTPSDSIIGGLEDISISDLKLYPNPAESEINVAFGLNAAQVTNLNTVDPSGKVVLQRAVNGQAGSNLVFLGVNHLEAGVYFLQIEAENAKQTLRFVIM